MHAKRTMCLYIRLTKSKIDTFCSAPRQTLWCNILEMWYAIMHLHTTMAWALGLALATLMVDGIWWWPYHSSREWAVIGFPLMKTWSARISSILWIASAISCRLNDELCAVCGYRWIAENSFSLCTKPKKKKKQIDTEIKPEKRKKIDEKWKMNEKLGNFSEWKSKNESIYVYCILIHYTHVCVMCKCIIPLFLLFRFFFSLRTSRFAQSIENCITHFLVACRTYYDVCAVEKISLPLFSFPIGFSVPILIKTLKATRPITQTFLESKKENCAFAFVWVLVICELEIRTVQTGSADPLHITQYKCIKSIASA